MILRRPEEADKAAILDMIADFRAHDSDTDGFFGQDPFDYEGWLEEIRLHEQGLALPQAWVPSIQLVGFDEETGQALSFLNFRLRLNDYLLNKGGHIGYSVRPSRRREGLAKESLCQALAMAPSKQLDRVLVTCSETNEASRRTILSCGGQLEDVREGTERYWINL